MVVMGDGESPWDVRNGFGRKKEEEMTFFLSDTKAKADTLKWEMALGNDAEAEVDFESLVLGICDC